MTKALTLSGSTRTGSANEALQHLMGRMLRARGAEVTDLDLAAYPLPIFDEDIEDAHMPEQAIALGQLFVDADIIFIASPEYNGSITPLLKNTIDWVSRQKGRPFRKAVFGIGGVSSGQLSTVVALSHLRDILSKVMALVAPIDLRLGPSRATFDSEGNLAEPRMRDRADLLADELMRLAAR